MNTALDAQYDRYRVTYAVNEAITSSMNILLDTQEISFTPALTIFQLSGNMVIIINKIINFKIGMPVFDSLEQEKYTNLYSIFESHKQFKQAFEHLCSCMAIENFRSILVYVQKVFFGKCLELYEDASRTLFAQYRLAS